MYPINPGHLPLFEGPPNMVRAPSPVSSAHGGSEAGPRGGLPDESHAGSCEPAEFLETRAQ